MRPLALLPHCLAAALALLPASPVVSAPKRESPAAEVSPALREFEKTLRALAPEAKKIMDEPPAGQAMRPGDMVTLVEKTCAVKTDGLPEDLAAAFAAFCDGLKRVSEVFKGLPAEIPAKGVKEWMAELEKSDPEAATRVKEFPATMEKLDEGSELASWRLESAAARHGIDVSAFLDPESEDRKPLKAAQGKTTTEDFAESLRDIPQKRAALGAESRKSAMNMGVLSKYVLGEATMLFAIPLEGLPDELAASFSDFRHQVERHGWALGEYPDDLPVDKKGIEEYITERMKTQPGFLGEVEATGKDIKKRQQKRNESLAKFMEKAKAAGLDTGGFVPAKPEGK